MNPTAPAGDGRRRPAERTTVADACDRLSRARPRPEDAKIVTLARSARARTGAAEGAAVRDPDGRTYAAGTVALPSLALTALQAAVAAAVVQRGARARGRRGGRRRTWPNGFDDPGLAAVADVTPGATVLSRARTRRRSTAWRARRDRAGDPPGTSSPRHDVVVVGGGIVGLAVLHALLAARAHVGRAWCERETPPRPRTRPAATPTSSTPGCTTRPGRSRPASRSRGCAETKALLRRARPRLAVVRQARRRHRARGELPRMAELVRRGARNGVEVHRARRGRGRASASRRARGSPRCGCRPPGICDFGAITAKLARAGRRPRRRRSTWGGRCAG